MLEYKKLLGDIISHGSWIENNNGRFKELISYNMTLSKTNLFSQESIRPFEKVKRYLFGELSWYLSGSLDCEGIVKYSKFWNKIKNINGTVNSNYGLLVFHKYVLGKYTNFDWCLKQLTDDKFTRRAIMTYKHGEELYASNKDFICTISNQFFIRNDTLLCLVNIRSSDVIKGLTYDIPWWSLVHQNLYLLLLETYPDLKLGDVSINFGSVHFYERDLELVKGLLMRPMDFYFMELKKPLIINCSQLYWEENLDEYVEVIKHARFKTNFA